MALHTAADIFSHSAAGVKGQDRKKLKKKSVKSLAKMWNTLKQDVYKRQDMDGAMSH